MSKSGTHKPTQKTVAYKGFESNWQCRGFQYVVGETYAHAGDIKLCNAGFHACEYPLDVFNYYPPTGQFAEVELGDVSDKTDGDSKRVGKTITIKAALTIPLLVSAAFEFVLKRCEPAKTERATGYRSASSATGDQSASSATGYRSASSATGDQSASSATGDQSASSATGDQSASSATGDQSASSATGYSAIAASFGLESKSMAGKTGVVICAWWDRKAERKRLTTGYVGEDDIKADVWYRCDESGKLVAA